MEIKEVGDMGEQPLGEGRNVDPHSSKGASKSCMLTRFKKFLTEH
jgi:hypothetical protein